jgi:hypothetical protein
MSSVSVQSSLFRNLCLAASSLQTIHQIRAIYETRLGVLIEDNSVFTRFELSTGWGVGSIDEYPQPQALRVIE